MQFLDAMAEVAELAGYQPSRTEIPIPLKTMFPASYAAELRRFYVKK